MLTIVFTLGGWDFPFPLSPATLSENANIAVNEQNYRWFNLAYPGNNKTYETSWEGFMPAKNIVSFQAPVELRKELNRYAKSTERTVSSVIRLAVRQHLETANQAQD